ncbi:hypothetical protein V8G54_020466, partial [Vigna mungo]
SFLSAFSKPQNLIFQCSLFLFITSVSLSGLHHRDNASFVLNATTNLNQYASPSRTLSELHASSLPHRKAQLANQICNGSLQHHLKPTLSVTNLDPERNKSMC